jgi:hypothetical protein
MYVGTELAMQPIPEPVTIRPTRIWATEYEDAWSTAPMQMKRLPRRMVRFRPSCIAKKEVQRDMTPAARLYEEAMSGISWNPPSTCGHAMVRGGNKPSRVTREKKAYPSVIPVQHECGSAGCTHGLVKGLAL